MLALRKTVKSCTKASSLFRGTQRAYQSTPDPDEKPVINFSKSEGMKKITDKSLPEYNLNKNFALDKPFPGTIVSKGIADSTPPKTLSTVLPNGLTVATQEMPGLMSSFAFLVRTGSSYESLDGPNGNSGCTHMLELNGFKSTTNRDHMKLISEMEQLGGMVQCLSTRENILYCVDVLRPNVEKALDILADSVLRPLFPAEEVEESKAVVQFQRDELPAEVISRDLVQRAAYVGYPLSNAHFCPLEQLPAMSSQLLHDFRKRHYFGGNCIVSAAGVDHDSFVSLVRDKFATLPAGDRAAVERVPSQYTGGMLVEQRVLKEPFVKVAMAFEVGGWADDMLVATCVLQQLLGGGSSFSAGGPGKGMYTRLYTQVLNRQHWAESVEAFVSIHETRGLLGIDGACPPEYVSSLIRVVVDQFASLSLVPVAPEELSRAKNMLKSQMMMQLESRLVVCEDIGRQFITYGRRDLPSVVCAKIDAITAQDLVAVADRMLQQPPAVSIVGEDVSHAPAYEDIAAFVKNYQHQMWKSVKK